MGCDEAAVLRCSVTFVGVVGVTRTPLQLPSAPTLTAGPVVAVEPAGVVTACSVELGSAVPDSVNDLPLATNNVLVVGNAGVVTSGATRVFDTGVDQPVVAADHE